jgi:hypothetical protein
MTKIGAYSTREIIFVKTVKVNWVLLADILTISLAQFAPEQKRLLQLCLFLISVPLLFNPQIAARFESSKKPMVNFLSLDEYWTHFTLVVWAVGKRNGSHEVTRVVTSITM